MVRLGNGFGIINLILLSLQLNKFIVLFEIFNHGQNGVREPSKSTLAWRSGWKKSLNRLSMLRHYLAAFCTERLCYGQFALFMSGPNFDTWKRLLAMLKSVH